MGAAGDAGVRSTIVGLEQGFSTARKIRIPNAQPRVERDNVQRVGAIWQFTPCGKEV